MSGAGDRSGAGLHKTARTGDLGQEGTHKPRHDMPAFPATATLLVSRFLGWPLTWEVATHLNKTLAQLVMCKCGSIRRLRTEVDTALRVGCRAKPASMHSLPRDHPDRVAYTTYVNRYGIIVDREDSVYMVLCAARRGQRNCVAELCRLPWMDLQPAMIFMAHELANTKDGEARDRDTFVNFACLLLDAPSSDDISPVTLCCIAEIASYVSDVTGAGLAALLCRHPRIDDPLTAADLESSTLRGNYKIDKILRLGVCLGAAQRGQITLTARGLCALLFSWFPDTIDTTLLKVVLEGVSRISPGLVPVQLLQEGYEMCLRWAGTRPTWETDRPGHRGMRLLEQFEGVPAAGGLASIEFPACADAAASAPAVAAVAAGAADATDSGVT